MADLNFVDKAHLEKAFDMGGGYVLDFSNRTFQEFVVDTVRKDIEDESTITPVAQKRTACDSSGKLNPTTRLAY